MKRLLLAVALLALPLLAQAQTTRIIYKPLVPTSTGIGGDIVYGISQTDAYVDSAWTAATTNGGIIGTDQAYSASKITAADSAHFITGPVTFVASLPVASQSTVDGYINAATNELKYTVNSVDQTDTGLVAIFTPHGGNVVIDGVVITGGNDTAGYTSNSTTKVGTAAGAYDDIVSSANPSLGSPQCAAASLVSPRHVIVAGATLYWHKTTAAVATKETASIAVYCHYQ
ncbi:hypothetical protein KGP36_01950 [Patescibacteria group bacterium]|nr:hypothetical protein [Patescibacteria group bacterium]